jgi:hypothetical protein
MTPMRAFQNKTISWIDENGCHIDERFTVWVVCLVGVIPSLAVDYFALRAALTEGKCYYSREAAQTHFRTLYGIAGPQW